MTAGDPPATSCAVKLLLATVEIAPWVREGASASVAAGLARGLTSAGARVRIVVPDYPVFAGLRGLVRGKRRQLKLPTPAGPLRGAWTEAELDGLSFALVEKPEFFDRAGIYGAGGEPYEDNLARFSFFARAVKDIARASSADLIHALDWPGALTAVWAAGHAPPVTLGLNNFVFQGDFSPVRFPQTGLSWDDFGRFEFYGHGNALKAGLVSAASVVLPGSRMASSVLAPGAGCGLEGVASSLGPRLHGILAGAGYDGWLDARSEPGRVRKQAARRAWLSSAKLDPLEREGMLVVYPMSLSGAGGLDLLLPVLDRLMDFPLRVVLLGKPGTAAAPVLHLACMRHPGQFLVHEPDDEPSLQAACAAADAVLVPDALVPADTRLASAMRAGTVPLAQSCPGLHEIVRNHDPAGRDGTGLVFYRHHPEAVWDTFMRALQVRRSGDWEALASRAAATDFSWEAAAGRYLDHFRRVAGD